MHLAEPKDLEKEVAGEYNTFLVYLYMLRVGEASARQAARGLGFSSPSLAIHHLEKLNNLKLVSKDRDGTYHVVRSKFGLLKFFVILRRFVVPRTLFYAVLYAITAVGSLIVLLGVVRNVALFFSMIGLLINIAETIQFYRLIPRTSVQEVEQNAQKNDLNSQ
jgi:hypothetical protein